MLKSSSRFYIFIICIIISAFLWVLIKLSEEYKNTKEYQLIIKTSYPNKILTYQSSAKVRIDFLTKGVKNSISDYISSKKSLILDLSDCKLRKTGNQYETIILLSSYVNQIADSLRISGNSIKISPDSIRLTFQDIYKKKVPVKLNLTYDFENQYELYEPLIYKPDSITVSGLKEDIDKISQLETESKNLTKLNKNRYVNLRVLKPVGTGKLNITTDNVVAKISVEKFTEGSINVPVSVINNSRQRSIKFFPDKVKVNYIVPLKDYNKVNPLMFVAAVDYREIKQAEDNITKVEIISYPEFTKIIGIKPERVEFIIW